MVLLGPLLVLAYFKNLCCIIIFRALFLFNFVFAFLHYYLHRLYRMQLCAQHMPSEDHATDEVARFCSPSSHFHPIPYIAAGQGTRSTCSEV